MKLLTILFNLSLGEVNSSNNGPKYIGEFTGL